MLLCLTYKKLAGYEVAATPTITERREQISHTNRTPTAREAGWERYFFLEKAPAFEARETHRY